MDAAADSRVDKKLERRQKRAREKGERLFAALRDAPVERPTISAATLGSICVAMLIHTVTLAVLATGLYVAVTNFPNLATWLVGLPLILLGVLLRPRVGTIQRGTVLMPREEAPALYGLVNRVARELGAKPVDIITLDPEFNASHGQVGLRRRRVLHIGLALWNAIDDQERVALLGHEIGHQVNGDLAYGFVVGSALRTLAEWHAVLRTPRPGPRLAGGIADALEAFGELIASAVLRVVRVGVDRIADFEASLLYVSSQRAEYYADLLSARVASTAAAVSLLDHMYVASQAELAVLYAARRQAVDVWAAEREYLQDLGSKEWERQRRIQARRGTSVDATHPPTNLRIELLRRQPELIGTITVSAAESESIRQELESGFDLVGEHLAARYAS